MDRAWLTPLTPLSFLRRSMEVFPAKTAIVHGQRQIDYAEFGRQATRLAQALRASGVRPGDRVACLLPNVPEMLIAHFGVPLAGATLVPINTRLAPDEIRYICDHSAARMLFADAELYSAVRPVADVLETVEEIVTVADSTVESMSPADTLSYSDFVGRGSDEPLSWEVDDETAVLGRRRDERRSGQRPHEWVRSSCGETTSWRAISTMPKRPGRRSGAVGSTPGTWG